ncbi:oligosaccharide flippase family protein [Bacillus thuringiensis]|uniref:flippase n=1 Tax=Bacillus TaxID=1386 RepID=UPI00136B8F86|nr:MULTISPECIES: flippase [Bacillus]MCI4249889.1 flippase [Bacillus sp. CCB-MMP212]MYW23173.1 oligosaccharide flippase family protein [Bacillus thuringiensis]
MSSVKRNFLYNLIYQVLQIILPLVTLPYISNVLHADNVGIYTFSFSIASYFMLFAMLGVNNYGSRCIAKVRDKEGEIEKTFWSIYYAQLTTAITSIIIYMIYIAFLDNEHQLVALILIIYVISGLLDVNWFFWGIEKFKITITRNIIVKLMTVVCIFLFVKTEEDIYIYTLIMALGALIGQTITWIYLKDYVSFRLPKYKECMVHFKPLLVLFIPVIAISMYKTMDKIMIGLLSNYAEVAYFSYSENIIAIPAVVTTALGAVTLPRIANLLANGNKGMGEKYIDYSLQIAMFLSCAMGFGMGAVAEFFVPVFFGSGFSQSALIMQALFPTVIFTAWASIIRTQYLIPNAKDKPYVISTIIGAIINLVVNLITIPKFGGIGAVAGTLLAEGIVAIYQTWIAKEDLNIAKYFKANIIYLLAGLFMYISINWLGEKLEYSFLNLIILICLGSIVYCSLCILYHVVRKTDIYLLLKQRRN